MKKMNKITIKGIKEHARAIKENGACGRNAWNRLELFLEQYDNINLESMTMYTCSSWRSLYDIVPSGYFI